MQGKRAQIIKETDNVATALQDIEGENKVLVKIGERVEMVEALERIPFGFKIAMVEIQKGQPVIKYGEIIGKASSMIKQGALVHVHNVESIHSGGNLK